ncbi:MAG TPA: glycine cleavage T C-terminal barrel domain-containing protein, partial [Candidatus Binataceae bacterium]|nr:glycine cleavage T C-terminal barrel domain-containing protein [Candidatus Binataceae bacterium]
DDALWLEIDAAGWQRARIHLEKLLVADDVEFDDSGETSVINIEGPNAGGAVRAIAVETANLPASSRFIAAGDLLVGNLDRYGAPAFSVLTPRGKADAISARLASAVPGGKQIGAAVLDTIRIENGLARVGVDTTERTLALEARMERAISFNKGCYVGQETIERATARGALKKRLMGLKFAGGELPALGTPVFHGGKEAGRITSVALSPRAGAIGLAMLNHSVWTPGTEVAVTENNGNRAAVVSDLPFERN